MPIKTRLRFRALCLALVVPVIVAACASDSVDTSAVEAGDAATQVVEPTADEPEVEEPEEPVVDEPAEEPTDEPVVDEPAEVPAEEPVEEPEADNVASSGQSASDAAGRTEVAMNAQWADNVTISVTDESIIFESDGLPSHEYLDQYLGDGREGKFIAGGVDAYDARFEIPLVPVAGDASTATPNGAIGVVISGAVFFNPFEGDGSGTVANDDNTTIDGVPFIDACGGHPLPNGVSYHYHGIPFCVTDAVDTDGQHSELIGYMFDGYGVYGPQDVDGEEPTDLDACLGHVGPTPDFAEDTYHYHVISTDNYISECFTGVATASARPGRP